MRMNNKIMLRMGIIGAVLTALCCVTPVLARGFGLYFAPAVDGVCGDGRVRLGALTQRVCI